MYILTIFGKDNSKQVLNQQTEVGLDKYNKPLTGFNLSNKMREIATTIAGNNYANHKFRLVN